MKEQVFKFDHHTVTYHGGGRYTLKADEGYQLTDGKQQVGEVETKDYTRWKAVAAPADAPKAKKTKSKPTAKK